MTARAKWWWLQLLGWGGVLTLISLAAHLNGKKIIVAKLNGATMGTTWHLTMVGRNSTVGGGGLSKVVQSELDRLESIFSNWRPDSQVEEFNGSPSLDWQSVKWDLWEVVTQAKRLSNETQGAFDITAAPLIDLWGFGAKGRRQTRPSDAEIAEAKRHVDWKKLSTKANPSSLRKQFPELQINVSALVEGYAIDELGRILRRRGIEHFLLEVGGEVLAKGQGADGKPWEVGVQQPGWDNQQLAGTVSLTDEALATAGVYHQYFEVDGVRYPHILDARTGRPLTHSLQSVSVRAASCLEADGWATALLILGPVEGRALATRLGINAFFLENAAPVATPTLGIER